MGTTTRTARWIAPTLLLGLLAALLVLLPSGRAEAGTWTEYELLGKINKARAANGAAAITLSRSESEKVSRPWTYKMAGANRLSHNPSYATQTSAYVTKTWTRITENVGYGPNLATTFSAFMQSAPHRANILDRGVNWVGLGVYTKNGRVWVTMNFVRATALIAPDGNPFGSVSVSRPATGTVAVSGWTIDPSTLGAINLRVSVDGAARTLAANKYRSDLVPRFPAFGGYHAFSTTYPVGAGNHSVCLVAVDVGYGSDVTLKCVTV